MNVIFVHGWSVTNTDTYGELPRWIASQSPDFRVQDIYLGKYVSFVDSVTVDDIARAFQQALQDALGKKAEGWLCLRYSFTGRSGYSGNGFPNTTKEHSNSLRSRTW